MTTSPQPESPEPLKVAAYRWHWKSGSPRDREWEMWSYGHQGPPDPASKVVEKLVRLSDAESAIQAARNEAEAMRAAIDAHNAECESMCKSRQQLGKHHCPYAAYGRQCPDCPRDGMLNIAMKGDAHA